MNLPPRFLNWWASTSLSQLPAGISKLLQRITPCLHVTEKLSESNHDVWEKTQIRSKKAFVMCAALHVPVYNLSGMLTSKPSKSKEIKSVPFFKHVTRKTQRGNKIMKLFCWMGAMKETPEITFTCTSFYWSQSLLALAINRSFLSPHL